MAEGKPTIITGPFYVARISGSSIGVSRIVQTDATDSDNVLSVLKAATADTSIPIGVTVTSTSSADESATIQIQGVVLIEMNGSTVLTGSQIVAATGGKGAVSTTEDDVNQYVAGIALAPSTADGDMIPVFLNLYAINEGT